MKLKIMSEGTADTTTIVNSETGEVVDNIISIDISLDAFHVDAAVVIRNPHISIDNIETQEFVQSDTIEYDGGTSSPDN